VVLVKHGLNNATTKMTRPTIDREGRYHAVLLSVPQGTSRKLNWC
jgi:hypothetical protein